MSVENRPADEMYLKTSYMSPDMMTQRRDIIRHREAMRQAIINSKQQSMRQQRARVDSSYVMPWDEDRFRELQHIG